MIKLGVIGYPLKHTLSPVMHNAALCAMGISGVYLALETNPDKFENAVKGLNALGFLGYNVTIPYKVKIMDYLDDITEEAKLVGAVNTVIIYPSRKIVGDNTDIYGFISTFSNYDKEFIAGKEAAVIGSGGASRAVGAGLIKMGVSKINLYDIKTETAQGTCDLLRNNSNNNVTVTANNISDIDLEGISILINASPVGMHPYEDICPLAKETIEKLNKESIVFDLIYKPQETLLLKYAKELGLKAYNGTEMLTQQGAKSLEKWTNETVPVDVMRENLLEALKNDG